MATPLQNTLSRTLMNGNLTINGNISVNSTNIALGFQAANVNQGLNSVAIGANAGSAGQGASSVAVGSNAAGSFLQGASSVAIGLNAAGWATAGQGGQSVAVGNEAGWANQGATSVAVGYRSGWYSTGQSNTYIGANSGYDGGTPRTGSNNTYVGYAAGANSSGYSNSTAVGTGAIITADSQIVLGTAAENVTVPGSLSLSTPVTAVSPFGEHFLLKLYRGTNFQNLGVLNINANTSNNYGGVFVEFIMVGTVNGLPYVCKKAEFLVGMSNNTNMVVWQNGSAVTNNTITHTNHGQSNVIGIYSSINTNTVLIYLGAGGNYSTYDLGCYVRLANYATYGMTASMA